MRSGGRFRSPFGVCILLGPVVGLIWYPFGLHLGSMWAVGQQSELVTPSGEQFDPPWTDLGAFLDPILGPSWAHVGPMLEAVGCLGASWSVLGAIWSLS